MSNGTYGNKNITLQGNKIGLEDNRPWYEKAGMYFLPGNEMIQMPIKKEKMTLTCLNLNGA